MPTVIIREISSHSLGIYMVLIIINGDLLKSNSFYHNNTLHLSSTHLAFMKHVQLCCLMWCLVELWLHRWRDWGSEGTGLSTVTQRVLCWPKLESRSSDSKYCILPISSCGLQKYTGLVCRILIWNKNDKAKWWWGYSSHTRPFPIWSHPATSSARASSPPLLQAQPEYSL